jgi:hypothetical protein
VNVNDPAANADHSSSAKQCDAASPCTSCSERHLECRTDPENDRRKKKVITSYREKAFTLERLLLAIQTGTEHQVEALVDCVRNGDTTHDEILSRAEEVLHTQVGEEDEDRANKAAAADRISIAALTQSTPDVSHDSFRQSQ